MMNQMMNQMMNKSSKLLLDILCVDEQMLTNLQEFLDTRYKSFIKRTPKSDILFVDYISPRFKKEIESQLNSSLKRIDMEFIREYVILEEIDIKQFIPIIFMK
jgi:hypothetical protein